MADFAFLAAFAGILLPHLQHRAVVETDAVLGISAQVYRLRDDAGDTAIHCVGRGNPDPLGPDQHVAGLATGNSAPRRARDHDTVFESAQALPAIDLVDRDVDQVRFPDEVRDEPVNGQVIDLAGSANLLDDAIGHDRNSVRHRQRLFLVMGHENEGDPRFLLQLLQFAPHRLPQFQIQGGERFVEKQDLGPRGDRARKRGTLLLTARELRRTAVRERVELDQFEHVPNAPAGFRGTDSLHGQAKSDVFRNGHVREQRVVLEDRVDRALVRGEFLNLFPVKEDLASRDLLESRDQPKQGGLAAPRGAQKREELVVVDDERSVPEGHNISETLFDMPDFDSGDAFHEDQPIVTTGLNLLMPARCARNHARGEIRVKVHQTTFPRVAAPIRGFRRRHSGRSRLSAGGSHYCGYCRLVSPFDCSTSEVTILKPGQLGLDRNLRLLTVEDARQMAKRRQPRIVFDFIDGAALDERAMALNRLSFASVRLQPRVLRDVSRRDLGVTVLGQEFSLPFGVAPMGMAGLAWPGTDAALANTAIESGFPLCTSTAASMALETTRGIAGNHAWFQLYVGEPWDSSFAFVRRARDAGYETLLLTVDAPQLARRIREIRNGFTVPFRIGIRQFLDFATHPRWSISMLAAGIPSPANNLRADRDSRFVRGVNRSGADWDFLQRLREEWPGKLVVKGVMNSDDAARIRESGADGIYVSNHGGRQLDSAPSSVSALPGIRKTVGPDYPLLFDGGVRSGEDIVKAYALGADYVFLGRPFLYALGAGGEAGLKAIIRILSEEVSLTMAQIGVTNISEIDTEAIASVELDLRTSPVPRAHLNAGIRETDGSSTPT